MNEISLGPVVNPDGSPTATTLAMLRVDPTLCECGHLVALHQTGEGPWTGFCGDSDCDCEEPTADAPTCARCGRDADPDFSGPDGLLCERCGPAASITRCTTGDHDLAEDAAFILDEDGETVTCKACLYGLKDARQRDELRDTAEMYIGHGCIDESIRVGTLWACDLCGTLLERSGDALSIPED